MVKDLRERSKSSDPKEREVATEMLDGLFTAWAKQVKTEFGDNSPMPKRKPKKTTFILS